MSNEALAARRAFLRQSAEFGLGASLPLATLFGLAGCRSREQRANTVDVGGYGPLRPVADENTGATLLKLPEGFRYRSFGWTGEALREGMSPAAHDGMGVVSMIGSRCTLIRNHEIKTSAGAFGPADLHYDTPAAGGCVAFDFDTETGLASDFRAVLAGTLQNCAGGVTPRGTWLSCEEMVVDSDSGMDDSGLHRPELRKAHGLVFEVHPDGRHTPEPIPEMGVFKHEAAATDPLTGRVYLTEDNKIVSGFFRFTPNQRDRLAAGGQLHMLLAVGRKDLRTGVAVGASFEVRWVPIDAPQRARAADGSVGTAVARQGLLLGATAFSRLEGCHVHQGAIFFTATTGGDFGHGQLWVYRPSEETLTLLYESKSLESLDYPDNLCVSPRGSLLINEDNDSGNPQRIFGMTDAGLTFPFAESNIILNGEMGFRGDFRYEEWCGVCFSPDGRWLFANAYAPGFTVAITGPWERGVL